MTAADQIVPSVKKVLAIGGRPHTTIGARSRLDAAASATICSKSSKSDTAAARRPSPHQLPVDRWHEIIGDPTYADAILDRLVHNAHRIELTGESMRRTRGKQNPKG